MNKFIKFISRVNFKSLYFNFKYFAMKDALKFPVLISSNVLLKELKGKIILECPIESGIVQIGYGSIGVFDEKGSRSIWEVSGKVIFKGKARIGQGVKISINKNGCLEIGENFVVTAETEMISQSHIKIGKDVLISWNCLIMDTDMHTIISNTNEILNFPKPIIIGNKVWVGCRNLILKGSIISDNSIIGAGSVVSKDISKDSGVFVGNPIKLIKGNVTWHA